VFGIPTLFFFFYLLTILPQISSIVCPVRSNLSPSEVLVLSCFPLSDRSLAIDVPRFLTLFHLGYLVMLRLYRTYAFHPHPFLCILIDVSFYSNTHPCMYLFCTTSSVIPVFIYRTDFPLSARSFITPSLGLSCPQSYEILEPHTNGPRSPSTSMLGSSSSFIPTSVVVRGRERQQTHSFARH